jgi:hypothetical protein
MAERLSRDLIDYGLDPYVWSVEAIYTVFMMRAGEGNVKPSTFQNILYTVRSLRKLFGLSGKVCFLPEDSCILDKYAKNWKLGTEVKICRAKAIPAYYIAELEKLVVTGEIQNPEGGPKKVSFVRRVWAWILRVIIGAGLRWSDTLYTPPGSATLSADGLLALGAKNKTHSRAQARPWAVSNFALKEPAWLETGYDLFQTIQHHESRDFWIGNSYKDESGFDNTPCTYEGASYFLRSILVSLGVPEVEVAAYRPHSLKASLMSAAVHLQALDPSSLSDLELSLLGDWKPDTTRSMALQYTREKQILQMRATKKVMMSLAADKASQEKVHQDLITSNELAGLTSASAVYDTVEAKNNSMLEEQLRKSLAKNKKDLVSSKVLAEENNEALFAFSDPYDTGVEVPKEEIPETDDGILEGAWKKIESVLKDFLKTTVSKKRTPGGRSRLEILHSQLSKVFKKPNVRNVFVSNNVKKRNFQAVDAKDIFSGKKTKVSETPSDASPDREQPQGTSRNKVESDLKKDHLRTLKDSFLENFRNAPPPCSPIMVHDSPEKEEETILAGNLSKDVSDDDVVSISSERPEKEFQVRRTRSLVLLEAAAFQRRNSGTSVVSISALDELPPPIERVRHGVPYLPFKCFKNLIFRMSMDNFNEFEHFHTFQCKRINGKYSYNASGLYILENSASIYNKKLCRDCFNFLPAVVQRMVVTVLEPYWEGIAIERSKPLFVRVW